MDSGSLWSIAGAAGSFTAIVGTAFTYLDARRRNQISATGQADDRPEKIRESYEGMLNDERKQTELANNRGAAAERREGEALLKLDAMRAIHNDALVSIDTLQHENHTLKIKVQDLEMKLAAAKREKK